MADSDDDKDLFDELHDDDDEDQNMGDFCVRDRLPAPVALQYTTRELHQLIHQGIIDLTPPYQRGQLPILIVLRAVAHSLPQRLSGPRPNKAGLLTLYTAITMCHPWYLHRYMRMDTLFSDVWTESKG